MVAYLFAIVAAATMSSVSTADLTIHLSESDCAAQGDYPVFVSVRQAIAYPGGGHETTHFWITDKRKTTTLSLAGGYYRFMMSSARCWEQPQMVAVIPGVKRDVTLEFSSFVCGPDPKPTPVVEKDGTIVISKTDCLTYTVSGGALAGLVPSMVGTVELDGINGKTGFETWTTKPEDGAYYFDHVPSGQYVVRALSASGKAEHKVTIGDDAMSDVDFRLLDFAEGGA